MGVTSQYAEIGRKMRETHSKGCIYRHVHYNAASMYNSTPRCTCGALADTGGYPPGSSEAEAYRAAQSV